MKLILEGLLLLVGGRVAQLLALLLPNDRVSQCVVLLIIVHADRIVARLIGELSQCQRGCRTRPGALPAQREIMLGRIQLGRFQVILSLHQEERVVPLPPFVLLFRLLQAALRLGHIASLQV